MRKPAQPPTSRHGEGRFLARPKQAVPLLQLEEEIMPAIQPIPRNTPDPASKQEADLLALHNRSTDGRQRTPAKWNPPTTRSAAAGENPGRRVK